MGFWGTALKGLAGSLGPGLFGLGSDLLSNKGALRRQQLADANNIKFWEMQNAYNTPAQQMARLKKAGLNPALIYGSGSTQTGVAGSISPSKAAPYNIKNPVPLESMLMAAQLEGMNLDNDRKAIDNKIIKEKGPHQIATAGYKATQASITASNLDAKEKATVENILEDTAKKVWLTKEAKGQYELRQSLRDAGINPDAKNVDKIIDSAVIWLKELAKYLMNPEDKPANKLPNTYNR